MYMLLKKCVYTKAINACITLIFIFGNAFLLELNYVRQNLPTLFCEHKMGIHWYFRSAVKIANNRSYFPIYI